MIQAFSQPIQALVLDEPFSQLDTEQKMELIELVQLEVKETNIPCLLISHDISDILKLSQQIGIMENGKIVFQGNWPKFKISKNRQAIKLRNVLIAWKEQTDQLIENLKFS